MITRNNCLENPHLEDVFEKKKNQWSLEHAFNGSLGGIFNSQVTWLCEFKC